MKRQEKPLIFAIAKGEMAEWSNAAVLKTVEGHTSGGSNPSFSAKENPQHKLWVFCFQNGRLFMIEKDLKQKRKHARRVMGFYACPGFAFRIII